MSKGDPLLIVAYLILAACAYIMLMGILSIIGAILERLRVHRDLGRVRRW